MQAVIRGYLAHKKLQKEAAQKASVHATAQDSLPLIAVKSCHQRRSSSFK